MVLPRPRPQRPGVWRERGPRATPAPRRFTCEAESRAPCGGEAEPRRGGGAGGKHVSKHGNVSRGEVPRGLGAGTLGRSPAAQRHAEQVGSRRSGECQERRGLGVCRRQEVTVVGAGCRRRRRRERPDRERPLSGLSRGVESALEGLSLRCMCKVSLAAFRLQSVKANEERGK